MKILSIHLSVEHLDAVTQLLKTGKLVTHLYQAENISEACAQIQKDYYALVLYQLDPNFDHSDLDTLVGLTLISMRIIVLGEVAQMAPCQGWQDLGVTFLASPDCKILTKEPQLTLQNY